MGTTNEAASSIWKLILGIVFLLVVVVGGGLGSCAAFNSVRVWNAQTAGKAVLAEAEGSRQVKTLEAKAKEESAHYEARAEVARAKGVAEANDIIMDKLGGPLNYLAWKQIEALETTKAQLIYVPTERGLPITEAGRAVGLARTPAE